MGWESDTNKFKIGDGTNHWADLDYFADTNSTVNPSFGTSIIFEGATADSYETTLQVTDPTADRTITFPDATGTVALTSDITVTASSTNTLSNKSVSLATNTITGTKAEFNSAMSDADFATIAGSETLTNKTLTSPVVSGLTISDASIVLEGTTADAHELTLSAGDPTADRTITFPDETGTVQLRVADVSDTEIGYLNGVTSAIQTQLDDKSTASKTETLTNKTLTTPTINGPTITATGQTPTIHGIYLPSPHNIIFEGTTADEFETTLQAGEPTADRTITLPDGTGTLALAANVAALSGATFTGAVSGTDLTLSGNLTVNGTTTNINSTNLVVEDKNIVLADVETPTDTTADGGGITLKGATDKTFNWVDTTDSWTSSEHVNLASGKSYYVNGTLLKDLSETLTNKTLTTPVISSISNTGTLTLPTDTDTLVGRATTDTLTNKTLTSPIVTGLTLNDGSIVFEGATANDFETTLQVTDPTADRTLTLPDATDTLVGRATTDTLTNKTLGSAVATTSLTLNATAELRLADTDSSHYVGFKAPETVTSNKIWVLPAADGTAGQALSTDGSGNLSWATSGGGAAFSEFMLIGA
jgi:hypothetical protein